MRSKIILLSLLTIVLLSIPQYSIALQSQKKSEPKKCCKNSEIQQITVIMEKNSGQIIDVRTPEEFAEGHIEGSINIPIDQIVDSLENLSKYENIVLVCQSGGRAGKAKELLKNNGIENVYNGGGWSSLKEILKK